MRIETIERYIKKTRVPYGDILKKAEKGGLEVKIDEKEPSVVSIKDKNKMMILFFESAEIYKNNLDNGLICTKYNY